MFGKVQRGVSNRPKKPNKKAAIPTWAWVIVAILVVACLVALKTLWEPWKPVSNTTHPNVGAQVEEDTNKDYRFYDLLPQQQVTPIPDQAVPQSTTSEPVRIIEAPSTETASESDAIAGLIDEVTQPKVPRFILQVRSYQDPDSADARRAEIILNGLSADIVQSNEGGQIWYRVISGPYESQEAAVIAQQTLQNSGIDSIVVKQ